MVYKHHILSIMSQYGPVILLYILKSKVDRAALGDRQRHQVCMGDPWKQGCTNTCTHNNRRCLHVPRVVLKIRTTTTLYTHHTLRLGMSRSVKYFTPYVLYTFDFVQCRSEVDCRGTLVSFCLQRAIQARYAILRFFFSHFYAPACQRKLYGLIASRHGVTSIRAYIIFVTKV